MFSTIKPFAFLAGGAFVLVIAIAVAGEHRELSQPAANAPEALPERVLLATTGIMFLVICFSIVPLILRLFTVLQRAIGNGDRAFVRFFREHERSITYAVWGTMVLTCLASLPSMIRDWWTDVK